MCISALRYTTHGHTHLTPGLVFSPHSARPFPAVPTAGLRLPVAVTTDERRQLEALITRALNQARPLGSSRLRSA